MKFTLSWLKDHIETTASVDELAAALTNLGLEVESITRSAQALAPFTVARVVTAEPHPNADKLQVCMVDTGGGALTQVVCGAPNARAGLIGVFAAPGTVVPATGITLKVAEVRGVESRGMLLSEREMGLSDAHEGIVELAPDTPVGARFIDVTGFDDPVIEIAVTPNRQDCMGVHGIARDLAAAGHGRLIDPAIVTVPGRFRCPVPIAIEDAQGCPAFHARTVRGLANRASPDWLQRRLRAVGQKPISALVDITNYVSVAHGRPLHVYDVAKLTGGLTARHAHAGEQIEALNGRTYTLDATMTVIADAAQVHDIGGIMGGAASGVSPETTEVLIECAYFDPTRIGRTGRALNLTSDARTRFERGVDPAFLAPGLELATRMVLDLCGGEPSEITQIGHAPDPARTIPFDPAHTLALAGVDVPPMEQAAILTRLGFHVEHGPFWTVVPPSGRRDIDGPADLVEEVARVYGYDRIPATPLPRAPGVARPTATAAQQLERRARRAAAALGLREAITWSFLAPAEAEPFGSKDSGAPFTLVNPISADLATMRPSLVPGLLAAARRNIARDTSGVALFEIGLRYLATGEHPTLALILAGDHRARDWRTGHAAPPTAYDAKALAQAILAAIGVPTDRFQTADGAPDWLHPGRSARLTLGPKATLAVFGELNPRLAADLGAVVVAELYLDAAPPTRAKRARPAYAPPALQPVTRDFAFVLPEATPAETLLRAVRSADKAAITGVHLFDIFTGVGVADSHRSLALEVTLQPTDKSFTEADLDAISAKIVAAAAKVGATLRS